MSAAAPGRRNLHQGKIFVLVLIAAVFGVAAIPNILSGTSAVRPPIVSAPQNLILPPGVRLDQLQTAQIDEVVDGDTLNVHIGKAFASIRYYGVDTPEAGQPCYREATDRNVTLTGRTVYLLGDARDVDRFGRMLRYVFLSNGQSIDATLVAEGFGHAWTTDGRYRDEIVALEAQAREAHRGCLWK
jgi:micrococcal nuclease